jgi:NAD(P)-dependent dehydrogenase (short-subunit alcohol dehydrogenase family)
MHKILSVLHDQAKKRKHCLHLVHIRHDRCPCIPAYHATKAANRVMTKIDALLHAKDNIRVNSVHPGFIWTPLVENFLKGTISWYGPIVMNTNDELHIAFEEYNRGTFIKHKKSKLKAKDALERLGEQ